MTSNVLDLHSDLFLEILDVERYKEAGENSDIQQSAEEPEGLVSVPGMRDVSLVLEELQVDAEKPDE
jgi:hypothetical protein